MISSANARVAVRRVEQELLDRVGPLLKFGKRMARIETGVAPSAGYFEELVFQARAALNHYENE